MAEYRGQNGTVYQLGVRPIGTGGEGTVYAVLGMPSLAAKIYHADKKFHTEADREMLRRKLEVMISMKMRTEVNGMQILAWPKDILYENGKMVGYLMPRVNAKYKIYHVYQEQQKREKGRKSKVFQKFSWKYCVQFAYNLSWIIWYLHMNGIVIGDLNPDNIAVLLNGQVTLIDCDSFDIRDKKTGAHYPCTVGLPELLPPELQTVGDLRNGQFSTASDNFALAIHIFRLLMNNADPFGCKVVSKKVPSLSALPANYAIMNGECPYVRVVEGKRIPDWAPPLFILPEEFRTLFRRTFGYTALTALKQKDQRATAEEWNRTLWILAKPEPNPMLKRCSRNPEHVYSAHLQACPWCTEHA